MSENENCSRPSGTHPKIGGYTFEQLRSESKRRSCSSERSSKTSERWCFCIYCLLFDNEASRLNRAYMTYESFPRILYHPQNVKEQGKYSEKYQKSNHYHTLFTENSSNNKNYKNQESGFFTPRVLLRFASGRLLQNDEEYSSQ